MSKFYIYTNKKDNRIRYVGIDENNKRFGGSYPRILMAKKLGRPLKPNEDVHHIDGNPLNNDLTNLEVVTHGEHQRIHSIKYVDTVETCMICGNQFIKTGASWGRFYADLHRSLPKNRLLTCSRSCSSKASSGKYKFLYNLQDRLNEVEKFWLK